MKDEDKKLIGTARQLARPCVLLKHTGSADRFAAVWGGPSIVSGPDEPFRHWLSIDCRFLPDGLGPSKGVLSVFANEDDCVSGVVTFDPSAKLIASKTSCLFAHDAQSLPPPDALPPDVYNQYLPIWQSNCPLYTDEAVAVLGGWHFPWPDGDWEELQETPLVLWTIAESEPWVEVWNEEGEFKVMQRIT